MRRRGWVADAVKPDVVVADWLFELVERPVVGVDGVVVGDVVAPVDVRARMDRAEPEGVDAEAQYMVEVRTGSAEGAQIDLVEDQLIVQVSPEPTRDCRSPSPLALSSCAWTSPS